MNATTTKGCNMDRLKVYQGTFERGERECDIWTGARQAAWYIATRSRDKREKFNRRIEIVEIALCVVASMYFVAHVIASVLR